LDPHPTVRAQSPSAGGDPLPPQHHFPWLLAAYFLMILFIFDTLYSLTIIAYNSLFPEVAPTLLTPRNLHISVNHGTIHNVDALLKDLRECVDVVKTKMSIDSDAIKAMVGAALQGPDPEAAFGQLAANAGLAGTELPTEMAFINEVLDALSDELCNVFVVNYFNDLYV
jgi:hypothetical protein